MKTHHHGVTVDSNIPVTGEEDESEEEETKQAEQDSNPVYCPICDSGDASYMGMLGNRLHFRCTSCGMDFSHLKE